MPDEPLVCRYVFFCAFCGGFGGLLFGAPNSTQPSCISLHFAAARGFASGKSVLQIIGSMSATLVQGFTLEDSESRFGLLQDMMLVSQAA